MKAIEKTAFPGLVPIRELGFYSREKIWDAWDLSADRSLLVATDRMWINGTMVGVLPGKGRCLAELELFWANFFKKSIGTFIISGDLSYAYNHSVWLQAWNNDLEGRTLVTRKVPIMPLRWVVGMELSGSCRVMSVSAKTGQELDSYKDAVLVLKKWISRNRIKDRETNKALEAESLKRKMDSLAVCLFRKASAHVTARRLSLCCSTLSFGWLDGAPVLAGDFFTPNSSSLSLPKDNGGFPDGIAKEWLVNKKWRPDEVVPKIPDQVLKKATVGYQEILKRIRK